MPAESPAADDVLLIDGRELARRLGVGISTIYAMRRAGKLPLRIVRLNAAVRFDAREVAEWVRCGCPGESRWRAMLTTIETQPAIVVLMNVEGNVIQTSGNGNRFTVDRPRRLDFWAELWRRLGLLLGILWRWIR
jgi:predicted DNA-binding transcriptional regulator AlpA